MVVNVTLQFAYKPEMVGLRPEGSLKFLLYRMDAYKFLPMVDLHFLNILQFKFHLLQLHFRSNTN